MQIFPPPQCVDEIMEDMPERDLLPKNMMKVLEVFHCIIREGDGEGEEEGREREEIKGRRRGEGAKRRGEGVGEGEESTYSLYCHNVSLSL